MDELEKEFREYRIKLYESKEKNIDSENKVILSISSALFGLLLAMSDKFSTSCVKNLLVILIISNTLTIIITLISFSFGNKTIDEKMDYVSKFIMQEKDINEYDYKHKGKWENITKYTNKAYLITFCITMFALSFVMMEILILKG